MDIIFAALLTYLYFYASVFIHELGHVVFGKIVGGTPYRMVVGTGKKVFVFTVFDVKIIIKTKPGFGLTHWFILKTNYRRLRMILVSFGGPLFDILTIAVAISLWGESETFKAIIIFIVLKQTISIAYNLFPRYVYYGNRLLANDGRSILMSMFSWYRKRHIEFTSQSDKKFYQECLIPYAENTTELSNSTLYANKQALILFYQADAAWDENELDEFVEYYEELLRQNYLFDCERGMILDALCSLVIFHNRSEYLDKAEHWSDKALQLLPKCTTLQGTRGAILVEQGEYARGIELLQPLLSTEIEPTDKALSACFLAKAMARQGDIPAAVDLLVLARQTNPNCTILDKIEDEIQKLSGKQFV